jgi:hypothetical protein
LSFRTRRPGDVRLKIEQIRFVGLPIRLVEIPKTNKTKLLSISILYMKITQLQKSPKKELLK